MDMTPNNDPTTVKPHSRTSGRTGKALVIGALISLSLVNNHARGSQPTLDELLGIDSKDQPPTQTSDQAKPGAEHGNAPGTMTIDPQVQHQLSDDRATDLFHQAVKQMYLVSDRLEVELDTGLKTQRLQKSILDKLDQIIASAKQNQSSSGSGDSSDSSSQQQETGSSENQAQQMNNPQAAGLQPTTGGNSATGGSAASTPQSGTGSGPMQDNRARWGDLPPRLRGELEQGLEERFSAHYKTLTEQYYKRLAEQAR